METKINDTFELFEHLLLSKKYVELNLQEKNAIAEFCSSEIEYNQMQFAMNGFRKNVTSTVNTIHPSSSIVDTFQQALSNKWSRTSFHLNSIWDSFLVWLRIENYALRTAMFVMAIVSTFYFSLESKLGVNAKKNSLDNNIIADSSYKNLSCDSSYVKYKALAP